MDSHEIAINLVDGVDRSCLGLRYKLILYCLIFEVLLAWCLWTEFKYRNAQEVTARFTVVGKSELNSRRHGHRVFHRLRYDFTEADSGRRHQQTVEISPESVPQGQTVQVQWIPAEMPESRLAMHAKPWVIPAFAGFSSILLVVAGFSIVRISGEVNGSSQTRQQRWMRERSRLASR